MNSCYEYEEYTFNNPLLEIESTYIIHLIDNGRYENIIEQLHKYPISKRVYILMNKGYKKCNKYINKPTLDLVDAYLEIFKHAKNKENILILEDDFMFDEKILDPFHQQNINVQKNDIYMIGAIPLLLLPYDYYNYLGLITLGTHSVIYSKKFRDKVNKNEINDWDLYLNTQPRVVYYTPLCYQLFPLTENSKHWGDHNIFLYWLAPIFKLFIKIIGLDKSTNGYSYFYFVSKLWFLLFLFIIWILLTFIISLKM